MKHNSTVDAPIRGIDLGWVIQESNDPKRISKFTSDCLIKSRKFWFSLGKVWSYIWLIPCNLVLNMLTNPYKWLQQSCLHQMHMNRGSWQRKKNKTACYFDFIPFYTFQRETWRCNHACACTQCAHCVIAVLHSTYLILVSEWGSGALHFLQTELIVPGAEVCERPEKQIHNKPKA